MVMKNIIRWLDNYWYHYKWATIIGLTFVVIFTVLISQCASKTDDDVTVLYAGPAQLSANQAREVQFALQAVMGEDYNGDGVKQATVSPLLLMTDAQLEAAKKQAKEDGITLIYNQQTLNDNHTKFSTVIFSGECVICLLDPNWYGDVNNAGGFAPLKDVLGYTPEYAIDGCSVYLRDTPFAQYFTAMQAYPEDTILCVRRVATVKGFRSGSREEKEYNNQIDMFRKIMSFDIEAVQ